MTTRWEPALRMNHRFALASGEPVCEVATLRRPELVLRYTSCRNISVDEHLITSSFPPVPERSRILAIVMVAGAIAVEPVGIVRPGESILLDLGAAGRMRSKNACYLNLEWGSCEATRPAAPCALGEVAMERVMSIAHALLDRQSSQRVPLASAFDLFKSIGAPVTLSVDALEGEPTDLDRRFARAIEQQLDNLTSHSAIGFRMSESVSLSERHIQRLFADFSVRYAINARSWRDMRNRWRVQTALLLLSRAELTVAEIAKEVGYASPNALGRAFSTVGFAPPAVLRQRMSEMDPLL